MRMPLMTMVGIAIILFGCFWIAFAPKEKKIVQVTSPQYGTMIAIMNADGTMAMNASVPYAEDGKVLAWDKTKRIYRWIPESE